MKILNKIKIKTKLTILVALMLISILVVGGVGYYYSNQSARALKQLTTQNLVTIEMLSDARTQLRGNFANVLKLMVSSDVTYQKAVLADIKKRDTAIDKDLATFEKTELNTYEMEQSTLLKSKIVEWRAVLEKEIELVTSGKASDGIALFNTSGEKTFEDLQTIIRNLVNNSIKDTDQITIQNEANSKTAIKILISIIAIVSVICIFFGFLITKAISSSITSLIRLIKKTADLDLVFDPSFTPLLEQRDEIGTIVQSVEALRNSLREIAGKIVGISHDLASNSEELTASTDESTKTINQVATAINEIAEGNGSQAEMVNRTSVTISDVADRMNEVNGATLESAENAAKSLEIVLEGQLAVKRTTDKMQENISVVGDVSSSLNELSAVIGKVVSITDVINSIATQTNLLALNAAIEAARAGEAGKGFAVVADEIRKLAEGSSSAAKEISDIVMDTVGKNKMAAENIEKAKGIVNEQEHAVNIVKDSFDKIKLSVEDISHRTTKASDMLEVINHSSKEIANQTQDMAAIAEQSAASAEEISASSEEQLASIEMIAKAANDLSIMALRLNDEINRFKV